MPPEQFGVAHIERHDVLELGRGRTQKECSEKAAMELFGKGPSAAQLVSNWPQITTAIRRGTRFAIEIRRPEFQAELRFDPEDQETGYYKIRHLPNNKVEEGRTTIVDELPADEKCGVFSMLTQFPIRFAVLTLTNDQSKIEKVWRIGLNQCTEVAEDDLE